MGWRHLSAVRASCEFDTSCDLPLSVYTLDLKSHAETLDRSPVAPLQLLTALHKKEGLA